MSLVTTLDLCSFLISWIEELGKLKVFIYLTLQIRFTNFLSLYSTEYSSHSGITSFFFLTSFLPVIYLKGFTSDGLLLIAVLSVSLLSHQPPTSNTCISSKGPKKVRSNPPLKQHVAFLRVIITLVVFSSGRKINWSHISDIWPQLIFLPEEKTTQSNNHPQKSNVLFR